MITLVRNRQWLIPYTDDDMKVLLTLNLRLTKYDVDYLPTLRLIAKAKKEQVQILDFNKVVFDPMLNKLEKFWSKDDQVLKLEHNRIKLIGPNNSQTVKRLQNIENKLLAFFERWGFDFEFIPSESKTKAMLTIDYILSKEKLPVIISNSTDSDPDFDPAILQFGNYRLLINRHNDCFGLSFEELSMGEWTVVRGMPKVRADQLSTSHFISTLFEMFNVQSIKE
jgi:hypothetical protein